MILGEDIKLVYDVTDSTMELRLCVWNTRDMYMYGHTL